MRKLEQVDHFIQDKRDEFVYFSLVPFHEGLNKQKAQAEIHVIFLKRIYLNLEIFKNQLNRTLIEQMAFFKIHRRSFLNQTSQKSINIF